MTTSVDQHTPTRSRNRMLIEGVAFGAAYGLILRGSLQDWPFSRWLQSHGVLYGAATAMTLAFLVLGPIAIGFLAVTRAGKQAPISGWKQVFLPWLSVLVMMAAAALFSWEGAICIAMATPIALILSSVGGLAAGLFQRKRKISPATLSCVAVLPFLLAPIEARHNGPNETRTVSSSIRIHASPETVWQNIERVPAIAPAELRPNWTHRIGFPRPVEATLSYEGVGGVRNATFERGLTFIETVTAWEPRHRLAFTIKADSAHIPSTTLDEHVTIGGRYFDVLDGEYSLEPLPDGEILLHLISHQRLSTDFNGYAGLWTDGVMQNLQTSILEVIQHRCESSPPSQ